LSIALARRFFRPFFDGSIHQIGDDSTLVLTGKCLVEPLLDVVGDAEVACSYVLPTLLKTQHRLCMSLWSVKRADVHAQCWISTANAAVFAEADARLITTDREIRYSAAS